MQLLAQNSLAKVNYSALRRLIYLAATLLLASLLIHAAPPTDQISRLAKLMVWKSGDVIADIGAGDGGYAVASLTHLGPDGKVYATELDKTKVVALKKEESTRRLQNLDRGTN